MAEITVQYNNSVLFPTPLVGQSYQFIDYGDRWGNVLEIDLNGTLTGIVSTGDVANITNIFSSQFGTLEVLENPSTVIYQWQNCIVDSITFPNNHFYKGGVAQYSVRLRSFNTPSGVIEPSNEYSFNQNDDGTVNVNHKISARGLKSAGDTSFNNAIAFVKFFTGKDPFSNCAPFLVPNGSGALISLSENINRLEGVYTVNEIYKYNTGEFNPYFHTSSLTINDALDAEYLTIDYTSKFQGSPVNNNINDLDTAITSLSLLNEIGSYGINTGLMAQTEFSIVRDSGACSVELKSSYISGYSTADLTGIFNFEVVLDNNLILPKESWKLEGDFICHGPIDYKRQQLNIFKSVYGNDWVGYAEQILFTSPLFQQYHNGINAMNTYPTLSIQENTGLATFKLTLSIEDGGEPTGLSNPKYTVDIEPSKWGFELLASANIEGHYIVQDLQMRSQSKVNITITADSQYPSQYAYVASGKVEELNNVYINSGFLVEDTLITGLNDLSYGNRWLGQDTTSSAVLFTKVVGSSASDFTRTAGYEFGY